MFVVGSSAFAEWEYDVQYRPASTSDPPLQLTTTSLSMTLDNLLPGTIYELDIIARGLGGQQPLEKTLLFTTKAAGTSYIYYECVRMHNVMPACMNESPCKFCTLALLK